MLESTFKTNLIKEIEERFPGVIALHLDPNETQGIPDLLFLYGPHWFALEGKQYSNASHQPNQDTYVEVMNDMSFAAFIYPENKEEILDAIQQTFRA